MITTLAALAFLAQGSLPLEGDGTARSGPQESRGVWRVIPAAAMTLQGDLHDKMMSKFGAMNDEGDAIFQEDVSSIAERYFKIGEPFEDAQKTVAAQHLGELRPFMGKPMPGEGASAMYVTKFDLMDRAYTNVSVVIHLDFDRTDQGPLVLKRVHAYLRTRSM